MDRAEVKLISRPWEPQDLLDDLQMYIDEEPDNYLNGRRTAMCMARDYLKELFARELGCEYCDGTEKELYYQDGACHQMNDAVYISENRIECDFGCKAWGAFEIHFCPMCGRKLKEGAEG